MPIRVVVVDDSALMRTLITSLLSAQDDMIVVGQAEDPFEARALIKATNPDVLTLDIEMPRMDGLTFLRNLMRLRPMPVVMVSTLTERGAEATLQALSLGAADFVTKPTNPEADWDHVAEELVQKVRSAATARLQTNAEERPASLKAAYHGQGLGLIALGASTGGTEALAAVLQSFPEQAPPVVLAQHIPPVFSSSYAHRLDRTCVIAVHEAEQDMPLQRGHAYLAPGDFHLQVVGQPNAWRCRIVQTERVNRHRPSVDVLFRSLLPWANRVRAGLLTGMGQDGAAGLLALREAGAWTLVQDQATSVVWGMPGSAVALGAACVQRPIGRIASALLDDHCPVEGEL